MECKQRLLLPPPDNFIDVQRSKYGKRRAFMICAFTKVINDGMLDYKKANCPEGYSTQKCIRILREADWSPEGQKQNPDNYELARVVFEVPGCT
jgi:hypothetical protein